MCFSEEEDGLPLEAVVVMVELKVRLKKCLFAARLFLLFCWSVEASLSCYFNFVNFLTFNFLFDKRLNSSI